MATTVKPRNKKGDRTGFTTGACSAAAARAATRALLTGQDVDAVEIRLPNRQLVVFEVHKCERNEELARVSVIKDAGDDPDCTHGAEMIAEVRLKRSPGIQLFGGDGIATVTKPGLGLEVGGPAINPVPTKNIKEMVQEELQNSNYGGAEVTIHVPGGQEMAKQTLNARLGLLGGISILGTTGIVRPYSTSAFKASVVQAIDVAKSRGCKRVVLTTGGRSERYAMTQMPNLIEEHFIQMGDFVGTALSHAHRRGMEEAVIVGMMGKLSKLADGQKQTHASGSKVNMQLLSELAALAGGADTLQAQIKEANTARHVLELCTEAGLNTMCTQVCMRAAREAKRISRGDLNVSIYLYDFGGTLLGQFETDLRKEAVNLEKKPTGESQS